MTGRLCASGLAVALGVVGGKWKVSILCELRTGRRRFGQLRRLIQGVSEKVLIQQLRELESDGVVEREIFDEVPPRVEYSLTAYGLSLSEVLEPLSDWGAEHGRRDLAAVSWPPPAEARNRCHLPLVPQTSAPRPSGWSAVERIRRSGAVLARP